MLIQLALVHPCGETIAWTAGQYFSARSRPDSRRAPAHPPVPEVPGGAGVGLRPG